MFFDELGADWSQHECEGFYNKTKDEAKLLQAISKTKEKVSWTLITADEIDKDYKIKVRKNKDYLYNSTVSILFIEAKKDKNITITGIIKEVIDNIDLFKIFKIPKNSSIGANLIKEFKDETYKQITIHTINLENNNKDSYTILISNKIIKTNKIRKNDNVIIDILGIKILGINKWKCLSIEKLDDMM